MAGRNLPFNKTAATMSSDEALSGTGPMAVTGEDTATPATAGNGQEPIEALERGSQNAQEVAMMERNQEVLVEGQIPPSLIKWAT